MNSREIYIKKYASFPVDVTTNIEIGNDKIYVLILEKIDDIYIIGIAKVTVDGLKAQCPFVPVHENVLLECIGDIPPSSYSDHIADISKTKALWESSGRGFFTINVDGIWRALIHALKSTGQKPSSFLKDGWYLLPPIWPTDENFVSENDIYMHLPNCGERYV